jgi:hypothetical protein
MVEQDFRKVGPKPLAYHPKRKDRQTCLITCWKQMMDLVFSSALVVGIALYGRASAIAADVGVTSPAANNVTNLPPWRTNACLVDVRGVIWNDEIVAGKPINISLVVRNVYRGEVLVPKKFNCNNYSFETSYIHGDGAGAISESDYEHLKPGQVTVFSTQLFPLEEPGEGKFCVSFHNNEASEEQVAPKRDGIPVVNHLEYNFGRVFVRASNKSGSANGSQPIRAERNRTSSAAGSRR